VALNISNRDNGLILMSIGGIVRKHFRHDNAVERVLKLVDIYALLKSKCVPHVDTLQKFSIGTGSRFPYGHLSPVGIERFPESGAESFNAVVCVLEALKVCYDLSRIRHLTSSQVMHSSPDPVYHRDIRQPNIIKKFNNPEWFLIDWCDASKTPTLGVKHLKESENSPRVRDEDHGAEVDIWGIAKYMEKLSSRVTCQIAEPAAVQKMARRWMDDHETSAANALDEIMVSIYYLS
jgi:hypothetical protein